VGALGLHSIPRLSFSGYVVEEVEDEKALLELLIGKIRSFDPDILLGYEIHKSSWGYAIDRAHQAHGNIIASSNGKR
jgi:DNA polymerase zeta